MEFTITGKEQEEKTSGKTAEMFIRFPFVGKQHALGTQIAFQNQPEKTAGYLEALEKEMRMAAPDYEDVLIRSIRIGGGSPTVLEPKQLAEFLKVVRSLFSIADDAQFTIETEPTLLTSAWMVHFQNLHVNRIVIRLLTGRHSDYERYQLPGSLGSAQTSLMLPQIFSIRHYAAVILYGLPGQQGRDFLVSTRFCCKFNTPEIIFERFRPVNHALLQSCLTTGQELPDDETASAAVGMAREHLLEKGYLEYKQNHFALPSFCPKAEESSASCLGFGINTFTNIDGFCFRTTGILKKYMDHPDEPAEIYSSTFSNLSGPTPQIGQV